MDDFDSVVRRCHLKAAQLRVTADHMANPFAQASFRRMAETYEKLAADFGAVAMDRNDRSKTG